MTKSKCKACRDTGALPNGDACCVCGCGDRMVRLPQLAASDLTLAWEPLATVLDAGIADLVAMHWDEVGVYKDLMPLACDWEKYQAIEDQGILKILAAWCGDVLIGYNTFMVLPHLHYASTMTAAGDAIFVPKHLRRTGVGIKLIDQAELDLPQMAGPGYVRIIYHDKAFLEFLGPVLRKRGYAHHENIYDKMVRA